MIRAQELAERIGKGWPDVLERCGIARAHLVNKHGPCPACGGTDRFRFDNRGGRGGFICGKCGAGDGFALLMRVFGWNFSTARDRVVEAAGLASADRHSVMTHPARPAPVPEVARAPERVLRLRRESCPVADCNDAVQYLANRGLWPLPEGCSLRAHAGAEYFEAGRRVGRYPAILADVRDQAGELVTVHVTYLEHGKKLAAHEPRKILSPMTGRTGCAVRLMQADSDVIGIAEGLETALAAAALHGVSTWSALNAAVLAKFEPPESIARLVIFPDADYAGVDAANKLMERLQGQVRLEVHRPSPPAKDWADVLSRAKRPADGKESCQGQESCHPDRRQNYEQQ